MTEYTLSFKFRVLISIKHTHTHTHTNTNILWVIALICKAFSRGWGKFVTLENRNQMNV